MISDQFPVAIQGGAAIPESHWDVCAKVADGAIIMPEKNACVRTPAGGPGRILEASEVRHPAGVGDASEPLSGSVAPLNCRLPAGIPPGCAATRLRVIPDFGWGLKSQSVDGEFVMHQECPEIEGKAEG